MELHMGDVFLQEEGEMVEAIEAGKIVTVSEAYALREGLPILKHLAEQATEEEPEQEGIYAREMERELVARMSEMRRGKDQLAHPLKKELLPHWHWSISQARRRRGLTRKQFGRLVGVSEQQMKLLENGILPPNASMLVTKIQDGLGVRLRKDTSSDPAQPMRAMIESGEGSRRGKVERKEIDSEEKLLRDEIELLDD